MEKRNLLQLSTYFVTGLLLLVFSILVVCLLVFIFSRYDDVEEVEEGQEYVYSYYQLNSRTNISLTGFLTQKQPLQNEYEFYENSENNDVLVLVSEFGDTQFQCTGSCTCENLDRRATAIVVRSAVIYLVSALSSILAINRAKSYFEEKCIEDLKDECSRSSILSDVEDCDAISINEEDNLFLEARNVKQINKKNKKFAEREQNKSRDLNRSEIKMVIVMRTDIQMGKGKVGAQCVHAALNGLRKIKSKHSRDVAKWEMAGEKTVVVGVKLYDDFVDIHQEASRSGIPVSSIIRDAGRTQFGEPTATCFAIGPAREEVVSKITGKMKLL